jgi:beta-N-acetylhexosaminidase
MTTTEATSGTSSSTTVVKPACTNGTELGHWTLAGLAAQLVVVPVDESDLASALPAISSGIGGVVLFGVAAPSDLAAQIAQLDAAVPSRIKLFVMADEEGGGVQRLPNLVGWIPWPRDMAETMSTADVRALARKLGGGLIANGVNMDLAPVLDLSSGPGPDAVHTDGARSFSGNATTATAYGLAFAEGLLDAGIVPVVKHFPGEGSTSANTDFGPADTPPLSTLRGSDLLPFEAAVRAGVPAVMVGNALVPGLTTEPASLSSAAIVGLLRDQLGFKGLVLTDSLSAGAVTALGLSVPVAAVRAVAAGADMVLYTSVTPNETAAEVIGALVEAVTTGTLSRSTLERAAAHVLDAKRVNLCGS